MSDEELKQRGLTKHGQPFGAYELYNIGNTTIKTLRDYNIIPNKDYEGVLSKKPDCLVVDRRNLANISVIAVVERKATTEFDTPAKKDKAIQQCVKNYCKPLGAKVGIVTDGNDYIWINPQLQGDDAFERIKREDGYDLTAAFKWDTPEDIANSVAILNKVLQDISPTNSQLQKEQLQNPANLADRVWQTIWLASGENPDACLATFVEIFTFKYLSDLGVLTTNDQGVAISFSDVLQVDRDKCLLFYFQQVRSHIKKLFPPNPNDNTSVINGMILKPEVSEHNLLFHKILKEFEGFGPLKAIDPEFKSRLYENFLKKSISQKNWGQFFTPRNIVKAIVEMSEIEKLPDGAKVHDPACGVGGFILEPILSKRPNDYVLVGDQLTCKLNYTGHDRDQKTIILAKANMLIHLNELLRANPGATQEFAKMFNQTFVSYHTSVLGSLSDTPEEEYDLIMTNPPFVTTGTSKIKEFIRENGPLRQFYAINATGVEGLFLEKIIKSLKRGGKAFVIVPDGILNRSTDQKLRKFIRDECILEAIISLPENAFYTTPKKTYILALTRKTDPTYQQTEPVFSYLVINTGETLDAKRFEWKNDLPRMVKLFKYFKADKSGLEVTDPQCKIWPISRFKPEDHWSVDRWWTEKEKIELGVAQERPLITVVDFAAELEIQRQQLSDAIQRLQELDEEVPEPEHTVEISLGNEQYFDLFIGKRVLKKEVFGQQNGTIPVYSANVLEPFGMLDHSNIDDFNNDFVLWGIDGNFHFNVIRKGTPFATTDHCGAIRIIDDSIDAEYLYYYLTWIRSQQSLDRQLRANLTNMKKVVVKFPVLVNDDGSPKMKPANRPGPKQPTLIYALDLETQRRIADFYRTFHEVRDEVTKYANRLRELEIAPPLKDS